jgi:hypothetical protein
MDTKTVFVRTSKGEDEAHSKTMHLAGDGKRALLMVDGVATYGEIGKRAAPSLRAYLDDTFQDLEKNGFIQDKAKVHSAPKMSVPGKMHSTLKMATPKKPSPPAYHPAKEDTDELDFMGGFGTPAPQSVTQEDNTSKLKAEAETKARHDLEAAQLKAQQEAAAIRAKAEQDAARLHEEAAQHAKAEAEAKARQELEAAKVKAQQEAEAIRAKAEQDAARLREEAAQHAKAEVEAKARQELESAKIKAQQEAEAIRAKAEQDAARLREEAAQRAKAEAEAAAKEHERAEAARIKAEHEAAQIHAELEAARLKAEMDAKVKLEAAKMGQEAPKKASEQIPDRAPENSQDAFSFDAFHISEQPENVAPSPKAHQTPVPPTPKVDSHAPSAGKPSDFSFESFQFDDLAPKAEPPQSPEKPPQHETPPAAKSGGISFNAFKIDESPAPVAAPKNAAPGPVSKPAGNKPDPEQLKRAEQARAAAEERKAAEEQAKKLADEQAKVWAEAEQRALEKAKASTEHVLQHTEHHAADKKPHPAPPVKRAPGKPFPWGKLFGFFFKLGIFLLVLVVGALFAVPYFMPMRDYMPKVEQFMEERIKQPVHIGYLSGRILPTPRLDIGEIYIGEVKQFQAAQAQLNFSILGLLEERKPIDSLVLQDVKVSGKGLQNVSVWLQKLLANDSYPISRMEISQGTLDADVFELKGIEGQFDFSPTGQFNRANLRAESGKYTLSMDATPDNKLNVSITVRNGALPLLPNWIFDDLTAKGELNANELAISSIEARILGGSLQGNATLNWRSGWRAQGALTAKNLDMKLLNNLLNGNLNGNARFRMTSLYLADLVDSATLDGDFSADNGMISGMGIFETARQRSINHLPGGRTAFNELAGAFSYANGVYNFTQTRITSDAVNATAQFSVEDKKLSGSISARVSIQGGSPTLVDLTLSGDTAIPQLRAAR